MGKIIAGIKKINEGRYFCRICNKYHRPKEVPGSIISIQFEEYCEYTNFVEKNKNNKSITEDRVDSIHIQTCDKHKNDTIPLSLGMTIQEGIDSESIFTSKELEIT